MSDCVAVERKPYHDANGRFIPGNNAPGGRPKGSRNRLAEAMVDDLLDDWMAHGIQAITACREASPVDYLKIVAMIVSKAGDLALNNEARDAAVEQFIEERRQRALLQIERMKAE